MKYIMHIISLVIFGLVILLVFGLLDKFIASPLTVTLTLGFHIKDRLMIWGLSSSFSWVLGIIVELYVLLLILQFFSFAYRKFRKVIKSYK